jgi:hypothetical protein
MTNAPKRTATLDWPRVEINCDGYSDAALEVSLEMRDAEAKVSIKTYDGTGQGADWAGLAPSEAYATLENLLAKKADYRKIAEAVARDLDHLAHRAVADFTAAASRYFLTTEGK